MPNFNTHWLVAIKCLESEVLLSEIKAGYDIYCTKTDELKKKLSALINAVVDRKTRKLFIDTQLDSLLKDYNDELTKKENHDDITCFSAYALGACGPDFWTVTSKSEFYKAIPSTAGLHFDLGHYNRSHRQFQVAIERWASMDKNSLQVKAEQAYFYGMATHIATDCVVHQLVNVYAGAYHVLDKKWENQHGSFIGRLWSTHNKVEHYWDSYIRFKYFGDIANIFEEKNENQLMTSLGFPTVETYCDLLEKELIQLNKTKNIPTTSENLKKCNNSIDAKTKLIEKLQQNKNKLKIEKAFVLPRIFCDRVLNYEDADLKPFLYDIIVDKKKGAYKKEIIFDKALEESKSFQFKVKGALNENKKLSFFASKSNSDKSIPNVSFNYLNYIVCPNLEYTKKLGWNNFYHTNSLKPFIKSAISTGNRFLKDLKNAVKENTPENLGSLGHFWNLDTGHGIQVKNIHSDTPKEVITQLKFIHVTDRKAQMINVKNWKDVKKSDNYKYLEKMTGWPYLNPEKEVRAFDTYEGDAFDTYKSIFETSKEKYFEKIKLSPKINVPKTEKNISTFFSDDKKQKIASRNVSTEKAKNKSGNIAETDIVKHRLTLKIQMPIAELSDKEFLGFYLHKDKDDKLTIKDSITHDGKNDQLKKWLKNTRVIDYTETKAKEDESCRFFRKDGLCFFETQILLNLEKEEVLTREIAKTKWNNVIEYKKHKPHYCRNYVVGTGRMDVLKGKGTRNFEGKESFDKYSNISPTEQIFFSLYLFVQTPDGWFDMLSKEIVDNNKLTEIKKIDMVGVAKIVLFYVLDHRGGMQVEECYIDSLKVKVLSENVSDTDYQTIKR